MASHFSKSPLPPIFPFIFLSLLLIPATTQLKLDDEQHISILISKMGIDFFKDLMMNTAVSSEIPLKLPDIRKSFRIPVIGQVDMVLENITMYGADVGSSYVRMEGRDGIVLDVSGITASLSMDWEYSYTGWLLPMDVSDGGSSSVLVEGMETRLSVALDNQEGRMKLYLLNHGCNVKDISIDMSGSPSWIDIGVIKVFQGKIRTAIEDYVSMKTKEEVFKLDSLLQSLPKQIPVDETAAVLDLSVVNNPVLSDTSVEFGLNGLFSAKTKSASAKSLIENYQNGSLLASASCNKMIGISLLEDVFTSAASVYFKADDMHWIINKTHYRSYLNTAEWRYVFPRLYHKYPNEDIQLNISITSPPITQIVQDGLDVTLSLDVTVDVLHDKESLDTTVDDSHRIEIVPVVGITMVITGSCSPGISMNKLVGSVRLNNFSAYLRWSKVGDIDMYLLQPALSSIMETVFLPSVNSHLKNGFPLPIPQGLTLQNAETFCTDSTVLICSNLALAR